MELKGRKFENNRLGMEIYVYEIKGKEWFIGKEIAKILDYSINSKPVQQRVNDDYKETIYVKTIANIGKCENNTSEIINNNLTFINEFGLYQLVAGSYTSKAIEFQKWIYEEVLPSLRKSNFYIDKDNIDKNQIDELKSYLFDLCESDKISLGKASKMLFGNESELKKRFITLELLDYENCRFVQKKFKASNDKEYELFVCNMSGTYDGGVTKHQLQVSITNAGYIWLKHQIEVNKDFGIKTLD